MDILETTQQRTTKMMTGLEHLSDEHYNRLPREVVKCCNGYTIEEQLKLGIENAQDGQGMIRRMLSTGVEAACWDRKDNNRERQDLREETEGRKAAELLLSLHITQLQKQLQEEKQKLEGKTNNAYRSPASP